MIRGDVGFAAEAAAGLMLALGMGIAAIADWRTRRVPNAVTVPIAAGGLAVAVWSGSPLRSAAGIAVGLALLWLPWMRGWIGGGDLKLLGASGAWVGPEGVVVALALAAVVLSALIAATYASSSPATRREVRRNIVSMALLHAPDPVRLRTRARREAVPLGVAIAAGALGSWWLR